MDTNRYLFGDSVCHYLVKECEKWAKSLHSETGCTYDGASYDKHLNHVWCVFERYSPLLIKAIKNDLLYYSSNYGIDNIEDLFCVAACAAWLHDVIEDCRVSYNTVRDVAESFYDLLCLNSLDPEDDNFNRDDYGKKISILLADVVFSLTNQVAKDRGEIPVLTYPKIVQMGSLAVYVKLCDRIANTEASNIVYSTSKGYLRMYREEFDVFRSLLCINDDFIMMWDYLHFITYNGSFE